MPVPYILDPFQRIIAFDQEIVTFEYRIGSGCAGGQGATYEKRTKTVTIRAGGSQTTTYSSWETIGGQCFGVGPALLYLAPISTTSYGTNSFAEWNYEANRASGVNIRLYADGWTIPGMPANRPTSAQGGDPTVFAQVSINGSVVGTGSFSSALFYSTTFTPGTFNQALIGAFNGFVPLKQLSIVTLSGGSGGNFTVYQQNRDAGQSVSGSYSVSPGSIYNFSCRITCPAYNYSLTVNNSMLWG